MIEIVFFSICVIQGLNGWIAFPLALDDQFENLLQSNYRNPIIAPFRKFCLFGFAVSSMFSCVFAWHGPAITVFFSWAAVAFSASSVLGPAVITYGPRGLVTLQRVAYFALALRVVAATALTIIAPAMSAEG